MHRDDPYAVLGVAPSATAAELRRAYHKLSLEWHPDRHMQAGPEMIARTEATFKAINHAYVVTTEALTSGRTIQSAPTPTEVRQRTRQEEQLDTVARAVTRSRLMMVAMHWNLNPHTYRRDVELTRRILSDAVVFGLQAFPGGLDRELPDILIDMGLASEGSHVRSLLEEAMQVIIDHAEEAEVASWEGIFTPLGYRHPAPRQPVPRRGPAARQPAASLARPLASPIGAASALTALAAVVALVLPRLGTGLPTTWLLIIALALVIGALALFLQL